MTTAEKTKKATELLKESKELHAQGEHSAAYELTEKAYRLVGIRLGTELHNAALGRASSVQERTARTASSSGHGGTRLELPARASRRGVTLDRRNILAALDSLRIEEPVTIGWTDFAKEPQTRGLHRWQGGRHEILLNETLGTVELGSRPKEDVRNVLLHELEHARQREKNGQAFGKAYADEKRQKGYLLSRFERDARFTVGLYGNDRIFCPGYGPLHDRTVRHPLARET